MLHHFFLAFYICSCIAALHIRVFLYRLVLAYANFPLLYKLFFSEIKPDLRLLAAVSKQKGPDPKV